GERGPTRSGFVKAEWTNEGIYSVLAREGHGCTRAASPATPGPVSCGRAATRPAETSRIAAIGPRPSGPSPANQAVSVAVTRNAFITVVVGIGGGQRIDHARLAAVAAASTGRSSG